MTVTIDGWDGHERWRTIMMDEMGNEILRRLHKRVKNEKNIVFIPFKDTSKITLSLATEYA